MDVHPWLAECVLAGLGRREGKDGFDLKSEQNISAVREMGKSMRFT